MLNISNYERESCQQSPKTEQQSHSLDAILPITTKKFLCENRPLNRDRSPQPASPMIDGLDAEGYLRYLNLKAEVDKRVTEQGWKVNTAGAGPVIGSE